MELLDKCNVQEASRGLADARLSLIRTGEDWGMSTSGSHRDC